VRPGFSVRRTPLRWLAGLVLAGCCAAVAAQSTSTEAADKTPWWGWWSWANGVLQIPVGGVRYGSPDHAVVGSDRLVASHRAVTHVHALVIRGPLDVVVRQGDDESAVVHTDDNIAPLIQTVVDDHGVLTVGVLPGAGFRSQHAIGVSLHLKTLDAIDLSGTGDLMLPQIDGGSLTVHLAGSGKLHFGNLHVSQLTLSGAGRHDVVMAGAVTAFHADLAGQVSVDASELVTHQLDINLGDQASTKCWAVDTLRARLSGQSTLTYRGPARVDSVVSDAARLRRD
jgi:hypothetical protein